MKTQTSRIKLGSGALVLWVWVAAQAAPVITNISMLPRLAIQSDVGITNQIQYSADLGQTNWTVLTNLLVTQSPYWFVDVSAPPAPSRFYRVVALHPPPVNMALIPAGSFTMGNCMGTNEGPDVGFDDLPLHTVNVSSFYMDRFEVTMAQWWEVSNWAVTNGYSLGIDPWPKSWTHPVRDITWHNAVKWCNARSEMEGRTPAYYTSAGQTVVYRSGQINVQNDWVKWNAGYRLPTEAEWEKAARGGEAGHRFPWTDADTISHSQANYEAKTNSFPYDVSLTQGFHPAFNDGVLPYANPVGSFVANGYGLYDMAGNVWEWCWDWYEYYSPSPATDPRGPASGFYRVLRGGSWATEAAKARCSGRASGTWFGEVGFRCVLPAIQP